MCYNVKNRQKQGVLKLELDKKTEARKSIEFSFNRLVDLHIKSLYDLRKGCAQHDNVNAKKNYEDVDIAGPTKELLDKYQAYIDSLDNVEDKKEEAGHFLYKCKEYFYGFGWRAALAFTDYIAANSPLKDDDKIHYLQYLLELLDPQKEENKEKKRSNLHPLDLNALKKLAEFQFIPKEKNNINDIFNRVNIYLSKHKKYAPYIFTALQSFAGNLQTIKTEDFTNFSETYFKAIDKMLRNKKIDESIKIELAVLNRLMDREGNSKEAIEGFVKSFADYFKNTGPTEFNTRLCEKLGNLIKYKVQNYSSEEQKKLQQVWLEACPLKRKAEANVAALSFLNKIGSEISLPKKPKKTIQKQEKDVSVAEEVSDSEITLADDTEDNETIDNKLWAIENIADPNSSDHYYADDYDAAIDTVNSTVKDKVGDILHEIQLTDNPKEKTLEVANAYNRLVNKSLKKNAEFDREMIRLFDDIIKRYDYSPEDVYVLLDHINQERHERSQFVKATVKSNYKEDNPEQKIVRPKSGRPKVSTPTNQLELDF